jgi:CRP-like cAMP-binding protein
VDVVPALKSVPLLAELEEKQLRRLARDFSERTFPAGTTVVKQGDERGVGFFVISSGEASVTVDGNEVGRLGAGDHFGEVALLTDRVRTATVTAETDLECLVLTIWEFRAFVDHEPEISHKLLARMDELLGAVEDDE